MQPLKDWPVAGLRGIRGVLTDIDDTLTTHGRLSSEVLSALEQLRQGGLRLIAVTGRPTYWAQPLLRLCDFDAVIAENGASAFWLDDRGVQRTWFYADASTRLLHRHSLESLALRLRERFPAIAVAADALQRVGDLAFDIGEEIVPLPQPLVDEAAGFVRGEGFFATTSSIHLHASVVEFSKQATTRRILAEVFGVSEDEARRHYVFIGDSGNDATMFAHYPLTIGVANVARHVSRLPRPPAYVAEKAYGAGFVEAAQAILRARP